MSEIKGFSKFDIIGIESIFLREIYPLTLFSGEYGGVWDATADNLYVDQAKTIKPIDGDPVWWIMDQSGNNNHMEAFDATRRGTYRDNGGIPYIEWTSTCHYRSSTRSTAVRTSLCATRSTSNNTVWHGEGNSDGLFMTASQGSTGIPFRHVDETNLVTRFNGVEQAITTRDDAYVNWTTGNDVVMAVQDYALIEGGFQTNRLTHFSIREDYYTMVGRFYSEIEIERSLTNNELIKTEEWLAERMTG